MVEKIIHLIPDGSPESFCGRNENEIEGTSLGMFVTCEDCKNKANKIIQERTSK